MKIKYVKSTDYRSYSFNKLIEDKFPQFLTEQKPDIILVSGGDGALLHAIQKYNHLQVPFLGRAAGTLNFLMNNFDDASAILNDLVMDKHYFDVIKTNSISIAVKRMRISEWVNIGYAINEVVLGSDIMGFHHFRVHSPEQGFDDFDIKGSGISVSTSLGSTGYNFNLGGPIIPFDSKYWVVKGIVADKYLEDIIDADDLVIEIKGTREPVYVFKDGIRVDDAISNGDIVKLELGQKIELCFFDVNEFKQRRLNIAARYRQS